jgi:hypothetical protein
MSNVTLNLDLYEFLKDRETHVYTEKGEITAMVCMSFYDLDEFIRIVGERYFDDDPVEVVLRSRYIFIELNDVFEYQDNTVLDYRKCFPESEIIECLQEAEAYKKNVRK